MDKVTAKCAKHPFSDMVSVNCFACHGEGEVEWDDDGSSGEFTACWRCKGTGESNWLECQWCMDEAADAEGDIPATASPESGGK